ncbi:MAG: 5-(carboxyamino)imidazole ribonucleotide synthase [Xanthomonadales bacterium]|nr:5-(carboxyamino)imidazole ribonucleotide synthase [Xanthomonadales bacterium]
MQKVGILGGGQLARMLALAGIPRGLGFLVMDGAADACAGEVAPLLTAGWDDREALQRLAAEVDVATFDFENVPAEAAEFLAGRTRVHPNPRALAISQDRLSEKTLFGEIGLPVPPFAAVDDRAGLDDALARIGLPAVLKTRRFGYDGKGQAVLRGPGDADAAWARLGGHPLILEGFVPFTREVSVVAVRSPGGEFRHYPLTRNWHVDGILSASLAPVPGIDALERQAAAHARALAERLDYVGTFALELFEHEGRLLGNEMAPRVHNSGHWTIEGAVCSQFENHLRAVLDLPLGDTAARGSSVMLNWIGALPDARAVLATPGAHWHDYGKSARPDRKVGHATVCADGPGALAERLAALGHALGRGAQVAPVVAALLAAAAP